MKFVSLLLAVIFLAVYGENSSSPVETSCNDIHLTCSNPFHDSLVEEGFNILTEETLSLHCNDIIEDISCKKNYLSICDPEGYKSFSVAIDGVLEVLTDLCNETSDLRKAFSKYSPCIANTSYAYQDCIVNTAESVAEYDSNISENDFYEEDITPTDAMIKRMCLFYEPFKTCVTRETRKSCGNSAAQLVEGIIVRMARKAIKVKCRNRTK